MWRAAAAFLFSLAAVDVFLRGGPLDRISRAAFNKWNDYHTLVHSRGEPDGLMTLSRTRPWPLPQEAVEVVIAWAQEVTRATGDAVVKEHADDVERQLAAGRASALPRALLECAGAARRYFDGVDPAGQTLYHLYELLFAEFGQVYLSNQLFPRGTLLEVAEDLAVASALRALAADDPARLLAGLPPRRSHPIDPVSFEAAVEINVAAVLARVNNTREMPEMSSLVALDPPLKRYRRKVQYVDVSDLFLQYYRGLATRAVAKAWRTSSTTTWKYLPAVNPFRYRRATAAIASDANAERKTSGTSSLFRRKKKAVVFTCTFGGGHKAASAAVAGYLAPSFDVKVVDTTSATGFSRNEELIHYLAEYFFNEIAIQRKMYKLMNGIEKFRNTLKLRLPTSCPSPMCNTERKNRYRSVLLAERPDVIITVFPMDLLLTLEVAKDIGNLPVLHLATDLDTKMYEVFARATPVYPRFTIGVPFPLAESLATAAPVPASRTVVSGYPVRQEFLEPEIEARTARLRARLLPTGGTLVLVMTGGSGQAVPWPEKLAKHGLPNANGRVHVMVIAGKNPALKARYDTLYPRASTDIEPVDGDGPNGRYVWDAAPVTGQDVRIEVATDARWGDHRRFPFFVLAARLASLMDAADVVLTKPGGSTTAEIAYRGTPAVYDAVDGLFAWEEFAVGIFTEARRGVALRDRRELGPALAEALTLGRSTALAEDSASGQLLDSAARVRAAVRALLYNTGCTRCEVVREEDVTFLSSR
jgi:UDP-N-acetylglucosamine:LPS N-acetylglucosamine transferase